MEKTKTSVKISIVTICYNVAEDLKKTIQSVSTQTYTNIEFIIVDGNSSDNTLNVISKHEGIITKWISEPDKGIYDAMNKGIDMSTGDWIIFMNAGDEFYSESVIAEVFNKQYDDNVKLIYGDVMLDFGKLGLLHKKFGKVPRERVPFEICHQSVFTKSDILKQLHYDLNFKICADCNSFAQIYRLGYRLEYVPVCISKFEVVGGISSQKIMLSYLEHSKIEGKNPYQLQNLPATCKAYIKSIMHKFIPEEKYNQMRFNSVKSRVMYNY